MRFLRKSGGSLTESSVTAALAAKGLTDAQGRQEIANAGSLVEGLRSLGLLPEGPLVFVDISGVLPAGTIGVAYSSGLTATPSTGKSRVSSADAAMLASYGLTWDGTTNKLAGTFA